MTTATTANTTTYAHIVTAHGIDGKDYETVIARNIFPYDDDIAYTVDEFYDDPDTMLCNSLGHPIVEGIALNVPIEDIADMTYRQEAQR